MKTLKSSLKFSVVEITPKDAEVLLQKYLHNRPISGDNITKYSIQMSEGKWGLNGQAIIIDDEGCTCDGWHRLEACIRSGKPFQTVLIEGVKHETWTTIDTGKTRSAGDVFGIEGITNPTQKAAIVAKYYALTKGLKGLADSGSLHRLRGTGLTRQDLLDLYKKHETAFDEVTGLALKYKKYTKGLLHASMIGGITAYLVLDRKYELDTLDDFWNKVSTSTLPLYTSGRNRLLSVRGQDKQKTVTDMWNKYISSKENIRVNITSAIIFK
nr:MAG: ParB-like nuclease domain [Bacteriophage sp.]